MIIDHGMEGYGLYWYCVELVAESIDGNNLTFELEHDARIIANATKLSEQKVTALMTYFVGQGLFENSDNTITCLKIAKRLDETTSKNPYVKQMLKDIKERGLVAVKKPLDSGVSPDLVGNDSGVSPDLVGNDSGVSPDSLPIVSDQIRLDKIRLDKERSKDFLVTEKSATKPKSKKSKFKFGSGDMKFAKAMFAKVLEVNAAAKEPNFDEWAHDCRLMKEREGISLNDYWKVFIWANNDDFWRDNIQCPKKLRKQYPQLCGKMKNEQANPKANYQPASQAGNSSPAVSPYERMLQRARAAGVEVE